LEPHALAPAAAPGGPLAGQRVLVTRPARQAAPFAARLAALGAAPVIFPAIAILPPDDPAPLAAAHARLDDYDLAVFVSANAAEYGVPPGRSWPPGLVALAPGPGTADTLAALGVPDARFPPTTFDSDGLLALPLLADLAGRRIVLFRGEGGREQLPATLAARGAAVDVVACYRRAPPSSLEGLEAAFAAGGIDAVTLTSSEGIDNLWQRLSAGARAAWRACPSFVPHPRIAEHARGLGLAVVETAGSDAGLLAGLLDWVRAHPPTENDR
jgi:uroporphyrinogen-III synthase